MEPKYSFHSLSCIAFFIIFLLINAQAHPPHQKETNQTPQTLDYLKNLVGIRKGNSAKGLSHLKSYLANLGYMNIEGIKKPPPGANDDSFDENLELAIRAYQSFFKLKITGMLDADTVKQIMEPRCGVADNFAVLNKTLLQSKMPIIASRYTFFPGKPVWPAGKRSLTYSFPPGTRPDINRCLLAATDIWGANSAFGFTYIDDYANADVKISFQVRDHGDGNPFDGPLGILAHAFAPTDGRLHMDGDEKWCDGVYEGQFDMQTVGLHEMGHILGLMHTGDVGAVMYPYISPNTRKGLGQDDVDGIKALYPF
ncbi:hypothetical protein ABFS83_04G062200 [Erythranthe nasuta]